MVLHGGRRATAVHDPAFSCMKPLPLHIPRAQAPKFSCRDEGGSARWCAVRAPLASGASELSVSRISALVIGPGADSE